MRSKTSCSVLATPREMLTVVPFVSVTSRSAPLATAPRPLPLSSLATGESGFNPVNPLASMTLPWSPPVSEANSKPAMAAVTPSAAAHGVTVRRVLVSVKPASSDSMIASMPTPPSRESAPPLPVIRSLPYPPSSMSAFAVPMSTSSPARPLKRTAPENAWASSRSESAVPEIVARWMLTRVSSTVVPAVVTVTVTPPPVSAVESAVRSVCGFAPSLPTNARFHAPAAGLLTTTSPLSNTPSRSSASSTAVPLALNGTGAVVPPLKLRRNVPPVTAAASLISTRWLKPSARSSVAD